LVLGTLAQVGSGNFASLVEVNLAGG